MIYARKSDYMEDILSALLETIHYIAAKHNQRGHRRVQNIFMERWVLNELRKTRQLDSPQYCFYDQG